MLKYFPRILHRYLNTFRVFSVDAERMKNTQREIFAFNLAWDFKETVFLKNLMGSYTLDSDEQFRNLIFWISLEKKMLYAYTETTLNGKISSKSVYISVNTNTKFKKN